MKKMIRFLFGMTFLISFTTSCGQTNKNESLIYKDENVTFSYPKKWEKADKDIISAFRQQLEEQQNVYIGKLLELEIFVLEPSNYTMLVFDKANVSEILSMDSLLNQRKQTDNDALEAGYLTKLNTLELKKVNGISMLIEDFNANTGNNNGRSYGMRTIVNSVIYEFTVAGLNNNDFITYKGYLDKIINSFDLNK